MGGLGSSPCGCGHLAVILRAHSINARVQVVHMILRGLFAVELIWPRKWCGWCHVPQLSVRALGTCAGHCLDMGEPQQGSGGARKCTQERGTGSGEARPRKRSGLRGIRRVGRGDCGAVGARVEWMGGAGEGWMEGAILKGLRSGRQLGSLREWVMRRSITRVSIVDTSGECLGSR